jgi:tyrosine-protein kinase Etk/Wzc
MTAVNQQRINNDDNDSIDLGEVFHTIISHWKLIVVCVFVAVVLAVLYLRETRSVYSVDGLVQIESSQSSAESLLGSAGLSTLSSLADIKSPADTEIQLIQSRFVLGAVVHDLNLDIALSSDQDGPFSRLLSSAKENVDYAKEGVSYTRDGTTFQITKFKVPFSLLDQRFKLKFLAGGAYTLNLVADSKIQGLENQRLIKGQVGQLLSLQVAGGTFELLIKSNNPDLQKLNSSTVYLTKKSLIQAVSDIRSSLSVVEKGKQTGIVALVYTGTDQGLIKTTLNSVMDVYLAQNVASKTEDTQQTLSFLDQQLPILKKELEASENKYNTFREKNNTIDPTKEAELLLQQGVDLKSKKLELEQQGVLLSQKYTANFPLVSQIKAQINAINQDSKDLEGRVEAMPELQRQYLQLYRDVQVNTVLYTSLLNSYEQLKVLKAGKSATVRILDQAIIYAKPIAPKKALVLLLAAISGGIISLFLILLKGIVYAGVKDSQVIEAKTGIAVVATVPRSVSQRKMFSRRFKKVYLIAKEDPEDFAVESLRSLRTMIHFSLAKSRNNVILITGPAPEIGKSFISANFAVICAQMGKSVILIDVDMRRGHLNSYFNVSDTKGLADYLKGHIESADLCQSTGVSGLDFISKGNSPSNPSELLLTSKFTSLMTELSERYDYVIIDSPPILAATDAAIIARSAGVTLMVARYAQTHLRELTLSLDRLSQSGTVVDGIVFNDVQSTEGYGYKYAYQYRSDK